MAQCEFSSEAVTGGGNRGGQRVQQLRLLTPGLCVSLTTELGLVLESAAVGQCHGSAWVACLENGAHAPGVGCNRPTAGAATAAAVTATAATAATEAQVPQLADARKLRSCRGDRLCGRQQSVLHLAPAGPMPIMLGCALLVLLVRHACADQSQRIVCCWLSSVTPRRHQVLDEWCHGTWLASGSWKAPEIGFLRSNQGCRALLSGTG